MQIHIYSFEYNRNGINDFDRTVNVFPSVLPRKYIGLNLFKKEINDIVTYNKPGVFEINASNGTRIMYLVLKDKSNSEVFDTDKFTSDLELKTAEGPARMELDELKSMVKSMLDNYDYIIDKDDLKINASRNLSTKIRVAKYKKLVRLWHSKSRIDKVVYKTIGSDTYNNRLDLIEQDKEIFGRFNIIMRLNDMLDNKNYVMSFKRFKYSDDPILYVCVDNKYREQLDEILQGPNRERFYKQFVTDRKYEVWYLNDDGVKKILNCSFRDEL